MAMKKITELLEDLGLPGADARATAPAAISSVIKAISTVIDPDSTDADQRKAAKDCLSTVQNSDVMVGLAIVSDGIRDAEKTEAEAAVTDADNAVYREAEDAADAVHSQAMKNARETLAAARNPKPAEETPAKTEETEETETAPADADQTDPAE